MGWVGKATITTRFGGREAPLIRFRDYVVPARAAWKFEGNSGQPDGEVRFEVRDGRPQCVEVTLKAKPDGRGLRTSDLGQLMLDAMMTSVFANLSLRAVEDKGVTEMTPVFNEADFWAALNEVETAVKAPKRGVTQSELEQVAGIYREHVADRPVSHVKALMGYGSERTAARRVEQAREAGLLPPTSPGKARAWDADEPPGGPSVESEEEHVTDSDFAARKRALGLEPLTEEAIRELFDRAPDTGQTEEEG
jgi:hypothetical protein